jgi:hypothetical protein
MTGSVLNRYTTVAIKLVDSERSTEIQDLVSRINIVAHYFYIFVNF